MKIIADTNTFLAVALEEPEKQQLVSLTEGCDLAAPAVLPYEIGNALSSLLRRKVLTVAQFPAVWDAVQAIPVELLPVDVRASLDLAAQFGLYAYDAYFLQCAVSERCPLLSLDKRVKVVAPKLGIRLLE